MSAALRLCLLAACALLALAVAAAGQDTYQGRSLDEWNQVLTTVMGKARHEAARAIADLASRRTGDFNDAEDFSQLVQLISDDDPEVRYWGVRGLTWYLAKLPPGDGGRHAVALTLEPLLSDSALPARIAAAEALIRQENSKEPLAVLAAALDHRQESVRVLAASALESAGPLAAPAKAALQKAASDPSPAVHTIVRRALMRLETPKP